MTTKIELSPLPHTWIFDLDGTLVKHNGYLFGEDTLLPGVMQTLSQIPLKDKIILLTARPSSCSHMLEDFLKKHNIRYDEILYDMPQGERILVNDIKPSGLLTAYAINKKRDEPLDLCLIENDDW